MRRRLAVAPLNLLVNLLAMHRNVARRLDSKPNLVPVDAKHLHRDHSIDHDALIDLAAKDEHGGQG